MKNASRVRQSKAPLNLLDILARCQPFALCTLSEATDQSHTFVPIMQHSFAKFDLGNNVKNFIGLASVSSLNDHKTTQPDRPEKPMIRLTALLLATAAISSPALAADLYTAPASIPVYVEPASDWTGFYVGIFGGAAFNPSTPGVIQIDSDLDGDFSEPVAGPLVAAFGSNFIGSHDGGFLGGIEAGYDHQMGDFVVGGIIDIGYVDYTDRQSGFSSTPASYTQITDLGWLGTIRARGGYLVTEDVLAYVHGGLAVGETRFSFASTNPNGVSRGGNATSVGFQVGAGVEAKLTENWALGLEYAYTNLGENNFTTRFNNGPFAAVNPAGADLRGSDRIFDFHTVKASLKYRF